MRAFIQCEHTGLPYNSNTFTSLVGLRAMGYECIFFRKYEELIEHNHT